APEVERLAALRLLVGEQRDAHAGRAAVDDGVAASLRECRPSDSRCALARRFLPSVGSRRHAALRRCSEKMTSVNTRTDGTKSARPGSSASVGSTMGSGWKSAMTHQKPQALGSGAK